jgi:hypothetical protein
MKSIMSELYGKTTDGRVLIAMPLAEYLASLPTVAAMENAGIKELPAMRPAGKATDAQRSFMGKKPLAKRKCDGCENEFQPVRCDQRFCSKPCAKAGFLKDRKEKQVKVSQPTYSVGKLTAEQKRARLDMIRSKLRKIDDRPARSGSFSSSEEPAELTQARRESTDVEF